MKSYSRLGSHLHDVYRRYDEAEKLCRSARAIGARLAEEHPTVLAYRQDYCDLFGVLGEVLLSTGRLPEAEQIFHESLGRRNKLVDDFPGRPYPRYCLGWGYQNLAEFQWGTHRLEDASESFRQAVDVRAKLAADFPGVRMYRGNLAGSHSGLAWVWYQMGRVQEAEQAWRDALGIWEVLARDYPVVLDYTVVLSRTRCTLGTSSQ